MVLRQPFGGMGKSAFGPGIKAGGPSYVAQLMDFEDRSTPAGSGAIAEPLLRNLRERLEPGPHEAAALTMKGKITTPTIRASPVDLATR